VHRGRVAAHCAYVHPQTIEHAGGIVFESVADPDTLRATERLVAATGYHGQLGLDFRRSGDQLVALECNPRATAGVHLMSDQDFVGALVDPKAGMRLVPAGVRRMYAAAVVRDLLLHWRNARADLALLRSSTRDIYGEAGDRWPALYQVLSYGIVLRYRQASARRSDRSLDRRATGRRGTSLVAAYFAGLRWDGTAIP
jgi:hypothetical protein